MWKLFFGTLFVGAISYIAITESGLMPRFSEQKIVATQEGPSEQIIKQEMQHAATEEQKPIIVAGVEPIKSKKPEAIVNTAPIVSPEELQKAQAAAESEKRKLEIKAQMDAKLAIIAALSNKPIEEVATGDDKRIAMELKQAKQKANDEYYIAKNEAIYATNKARSMSGTMNSALSSKDRRNAISNKQAEQDAKRDADKANARLVVAQSKKELADMAYTRFTQEYKNRIASEVAELKQ